MAWLNSYESYVVAVAVAAFYNVGWVVIVLQASSQLEFVWFHTRDEKHVKWVDCLKAALSDLQAYVKAHHTTGLVWSKTVSSMDIVLM